MEIVNAMDQQGFELMLISITSVDSCIAENAAESTLKMSINTEIRDFEWNSTLYDSLWKGISKCWQQASFVDAQSLPPIWKMEKLLWNILKAISQFPEFDLDMAVASSILNEQAVHALFKRAVINSSLIWQQCLHWIYLNKVVLRPMIRLNLCAALLQKDSISVPASIAKARHTDGGNSRDHIAPLLEVLICIIEGFTYLKTVHTDLIMQIIMPLHSPNEMVEWRDQIPVLQVSNYILYYIYDNHILYQQFVYFP
jgi:hypothetical protein